MQHGLRLLVAGWLCIALSAWAAAPVPLAVSGPAGEFRDRFADEVHAALGSRARVADEATAAVVIALGNEAFLAAATSDKPVIGVYVDRATLLQAQEAGCRCSAVWPFASPAAQLALLNELLPGARRVAVLVGEQSAALLPMVESEAARQRLAVVSHRLSPGDSLGVELARLLRQADVLLALHDGDIFNSNNARLLLMTSYRHGRPVIGPDEQWVRAGSLASAWIPREAMIATLVPMVEQVLAGKPLPPPAYASPHTSVNEHVAQAYGVEVPEDAAPQRGLRGAQ